MGVYSNLTNISDLSDSSLSSSISTSNQNFDNLQAAIQAFLTAIAFDETNNNISVNTISASSIIASSSIRVVQNGSTKMQVDADGVLTTQSALANLFQTPLLRLQDNTGKLGAAGLIGDVIYANNTAPAGEGFYGYTDDNGWVKLSSGQAASGPVGTAFTGIANTQGTVIFGASNATDTLQFEGQGGTTVSLDAVNKRVVISSANANTNSFSQIANAVGNVQLSAASPSSIFRIEGTGDTTVAFNNATNKVTINSPVQTPGFSKFASASGAIQFEAASINDTVRIAGENGININFNPTTKQVSIGIDQEALNSVSAFTVSNNGTDIASTDPATNLTKMEQLDFKEGPSNLSSSILAVADPSSDKVTVFVRPIAPPTFAADVVVSLPFGKSVGRYNSGETIPAAGKTAEEVFNLIAQEPIAPTVSLSSSTSILFNQTAISNELVFSKTINTLGANIATAVLQWRRNGSGAWTTLMSNTGTSTYTHSLTDTAFNTQPFNYQYIVTDSAGATATATLTITPQSYQSPSISFSAPASALALSIESNQVRERGNTSSVLQGSTSRNRVNVPISGFQYAVSFNSGAYANIGTAGTLAAAGGSFTNFTDTSITSSATSATYRVSVTDSYTTATASYNITYKYVVFYGPSATSPTNSAGVRSLANRRFTDAGNTFILNTGAAQTIFTVAVPATMSLTQVLDLDALNANITANYVLSTFNVNDGGGTPVAYKIYTLTNAIPYSSDHRHQITIA
jgi:hypothetical protein